MTETERATLYWRVAIGLVLLSPAFGYWFAVHISRLDYRQGLFLIFLVASLPAAFLFELLACLAHGRQLSGRFWLDRPSVAVEGRVDRPVAEVVAEIRKRLERLSFQVFDAENGALNFAKNQAPQVHAFLDHAFSGQARAESRAHGVTVQVSLTLQTQVLLETGESEGTRRLAEYIGLMSDVASAPQVTLITYCGMVVAFTSAVLMAGSHVYPRQISALVTSGSAAALGLFAFALFYTVKHRPRLFGFRLIISGAYLAGVPLAVAAFRILKNL